MVNETEPEDNQQEQSQADPKTEENKDEVQEQSEESFPASDPPSY